MPKKREPRMLCYCRVLGLTALLGLGLITTPLRSNSQGIPSDPIPVGVRQAARFLNDLPSPIVRTAGTEPEKRIRNNFSLTPSFTAVSGASVYRAAVSWVNQATALPIQLIAGANRIDLGDQANHGASIDGSLKLYAVDTVGTITARAVLSRTFDVSTQENFFLAGDHPFEFLTQALSIGATGGYTIVNVDGGDKQKGPIFATGLTWGVSSLAEMDFDYQFRTDVVGEDDFSITVIQSLANLPRQPTLIVVGGKHRVLSASIVIPLYAR